MNKEDKTLEEEWQNTNSPLILFAYDVARSNLKYQFEERKDLIYNATKIAFISFNAYMKDDSELSLDKIAYELSQLIIQETNCIEELDNMGRREIITYLEELGVL